MVTSVYALTYFQPKFVIVNRKTGEQVNAHVKYEAEQFVVFHHANAYEEDGNYSYID